MQAMIFEGVGKPLALKQVPTPVAGDDQVLIKVIACGICRTDLHVIAFIYYFNYLSSSYLYFQIFKIPLV